MATRRQLADAGYWFGPRSGRLGWGWTPVSWQGWAAVAVVVAVGIAAQIVGHGERHGALYVVPVVAAVLGVCLWKGTAPGPSKRATKQLQEIARQQQRSLPLRAVTGHYC